MGEISTNVKSSDTDLNKQKPVKRRLAIEHLFNIDTCSTSTNSMGNFTKTRVADDYNSLERDDSHGDYDLCSTPSQHREHNPSWVK
nr:hypothetical transcript [Hymenolepis microstoma]